MKYIKQEPHISFCGHLLSAGLGLVYTGTYSFTHTYTIINK